MKRVLQEDGLVVLNNVALFVYFYSRACVVYCSRLSDEKSANKGGRIGGGSRPRRFILKSFCADISLTSRVGVLLSIVSTTASSGHT